MKSTSAFSLLVILRSTLQNRAVKVFSNEILSTIWFSSEIVGWVGTEHVMQDIFISITVTKLNAPSPAK